MNRGDTAEIISPVKPKPKGNLMLLKSLIGSLCVVSVCVCLYMILLSVTAVRVILSK